MADEKKNVCDCGHDHDCDCGCDMDEGIVTLVDEDGNDVPFYHLATLEHEGKEYACLQQADEEDPVVEIFEIGEEEQDGEEYDVLLPIDDELYEVLYAKLEEEIASATGNCDDPGCDCHHHDDKK